ncbi:MAG: ABC transporter permease [Armatimonadota bacterium]
MSGLRALASNREAVLFALLIGALAVAALASPSFLQVNNLLEIGRLIAEAGLIAVGMTAVIITAGIDLSVGATLALCAVILGKSWHDAGMSIWTASAVGVVAGGLAGGFNGLLVTRLGLPPLIVTLATMALYRGLALGLSHAEPVHGYPDSFLLLGQGYWQLGPVALPVQFPLVALVIIVSGLYLSRSVWGRWLYALGRNEAAARIAGVPVDALKMAAYVGTGLLTGLAAVIYVARVSTAKADAGTMMELDVITACVLGGVSIAGGEGSIWGTALGLMLLAVVRRGMDLRQVGNAEQAIVVGTVLVLAVAAHSAWSRATQAARLGKAGARAGSAE